MGGRGGWAPYLGYATCYAWTFCMSSIYEFGGAPTASSFFRCVLPGVLACLLVLVAAVTVRAPAPGRVLRRFMHSPAPAFLASLGTFLAVMPEFADVPGLALAGSLTSGFFFLFVLAQWGVAFARLDGRAIVGVSGIAFAVAALVAFAVSWMPLNAAGLVVSLMPLAGFACQRSLGRDVWGLSGATASPSRELLGNMPWRTFAGLFSVYFAYNGVITVRTMHESWLGGVSLAFLALPAALALAFVALSRVCGGQRGLSLVAKGALVAVTVPFMLVSYAVEIPGSLAFADGLAMYASAWVILVFAARETGLASGAWDASRALAAFCCGWLAQTAGGALSYAVAPLAGVSEMLYTFLMVAFIIVSGVEFFSDAGVRGQSAEAASDTPDAGIAPGVPASPAVQPAPVEAIARSSSLEAFCARHALSARESEVFALWVSGHGVHDIAGRLAMSESTAKTHVRHIYDKCGVYGKANLLAAYERWQAEAASEPCGSDVRASGEGVRTQ